VVVELEELIMIKQVVNLLEQVVDLEAYVSDKFILLQKERQYLIQYRFWGCC
jgi:hypothetical protein